MITRIYCATGKEASPKMVRNSPNVALVAQRRNKSAPWAQRKAHQPGKDRRHDQVDSDQDEVAELDPRCKIPALGEMKPCMAIPRKTKE